MERKRIPRRALLIAAVLAVIFIGGWWGITKMIRLADKDRRPRVRLRKDINLAGLRMIKYDVQYDDGDHDDFVDVEPFGTVNDMTRSRNGTTECFYYNDPGRTLVAFRPGREITPEMQRRYNLLARLFKEQYDVDAMPWADLRDVKDMKDAEANERNQVTLRIEGFEKD